MSKNRHHHNDDTDSGNVQDTGTEQDSFRPAGVFSDEPTRVGQLIARFLSGQSGLVLGDTRAPASTTARAVLTVGADQRDDCAVFDLTGPVTLVAGADYVRGPRFALYQAGLLSNLDIGYYLVVANVSDIAAMGAIPIGVLTVVRYPPQLPDDAFHDIMAGIHQACTDLAVPSIGGDIGTAERIILSGAALGICPPGTVLTRAGAQPGDLLCVTGPCGLLGAAVAYFTGRHAQGWTIDNSIEEQLVRGWRRPRARVAEGRLLSAGGFATACQDTSDGLRATIEQLATAGGVGFDIAQEAVTIDPAVAAVAKLLHVDDIVLAMSASPDFHLAFTVPPPRLQACRAAFAAHGLSFEVIGHATAGAPATPDQPEGPGGSGGSRLRLIGPAGQAQPLPGVTWRHQNTDISQLITTRAGQDDPAGPEQESSTR